MVTAPVIRSPSPNRPTGPSQTAASAAAHWSQSARVGARQSAGVRVAAMAPSASLVLPLPVGNTTVPRRPACRQAVSAAS